MQLVMGETTKSAWSLIYQETAGDRDACNDNEKSPAEAGLF